MQQQILIIMVWVLYGALAAGQTKPSSDYDHIFNSKAVIYAVFIAFAPLVLLLRCINGAFKQYDFD